MLLPCDAHTQATELECRHLIEKELMRKVSEIDRDHKSRIRDLETQLDQSESRIADLESMLANKQSQTEASGCQGRLEVANGQLLRQLSQSQNEVNLLQSKLTALRTQLQDSRNVGRRCRWQALCTYSRYPLLPVVM